MRGLPASRAWTTTVTSELLLPGYHIDPESGAWRTLPWPTDPDERMAIVRRSLGPALIDWAEGRTDEPGLTHYLSGQPWTFTPGQKRFLILWYALSEDGRFDFRRGVKRGAKGTGKDPFAGSIADMELLGPAELHDWDDRTGRPVGRRRGMPLVQIASNSEPQSKDLLRVANGLLGRDAREFYGLDCGETRTVVKGSGGRIEVNTFSEASNEGDPVTCSILNETHHMTTEEGRRVAAQARRNVGKSPASIQARSIEFTNAHRSGAESVAEGSYRAWQKQQRPDHPGKRDILYDSIEAPPDTDILTAEGRIAGLVAAYSDAPWSDIERLADEMIDPDTTVADTIRYYLNGLAAEEDAWVDPQRFDALAEQKVIRDGEQIALFLDCSKSEDATGLVACRLSDLYCWDVDVWQRPYGWDREMHGVWRVDRTEVDVVVRATFAKFRVEWFGVDPSPAQDDDTEASYWMPMIDGWHRDFGKKLNVWATPRHSILFDMRQSKYGGKQRNFEFTKAAEQVAQWIDEDEPESFTFRHCGSPALREHVHNAKARPNQDGVSLAKVTRDSHKKIDLAVCMVGAVMGARLALNSGKVRLRSGAKAPRRIY